MNNVESCHLPKACHVLDTFPLLPHSVHKTLWQWRWKPKLGWFSNIVSGKSRIQIQIHSPQNLCSFHSALHTVPCVGKGFENCEGLDKQLLLFLCVVFHGFMLLSKFYFCSLLAWSEILRETFFPVWNSLEKKCNGVCSRLAYLSCRSVQLPHFRGEKSHCNGFPRDPTDMDEESSPPSLSLSPNIRVSIGKIPSFPA